MLFCEKKYPMSCCQLSRRRVTKHDQGISNRRYPMCKRLSPSRVILCMGYFFALQVNASSAAVGNDSAMNDSGLKVMGESALIDKETGRVIWEGRSTSTLSSSVNPHLTGRGLNHIKATLLSSILVLALLSAIASWIRFQLEQASSASADARSLPARITVFFAQWTILKVPKFDTWFLVTAACLYFWEAHTCSTRRYLANAISSPSGVEEYIESLRSHNPVISWKVRSFHYEQRKWLWPILYLIQRLQNISIEERASLGNTPAVFKKKVVSHLEKGNYEYTSCQDNTIAGVWKRAPATSTRSAPFAKISLSKLIVLSNEKARQEYFKQQADFVTEKGQGDEFAEFSTNIVVEGFKPRMLAVRDVEGVPSAKLFRIQLFWLFTLLGLTVPYRIWFARHCDELRVTVVKETSSEKPSSWTKKGWFSRKLEENFGEEFRKRMQEFALYKKVDDNATIEETEAQILMDNMEAARMAINLTSTNETSTMTEPTVTDIVDDAATASNHSSNEKPLENNRK